MEFQWSSFKSWNMMLWKCCTQYARKYGKPSSGHRTGKCQFSIQAQRKQCQRMLKLLHNCTHLTRNGNPLHVLAWRIPGTGEPGGLPSMGSHRVGHDWSDLAAAAAHASKVMLKILQARLQQYVNRELPDAQAGFRKGRGTRDQIANICWIIEKAREFQRNIYFYFID